MKGGGGDNFEVFREPGIIQQGTHSTRTTGKMANKILCQGKHREFGNVVKTQGIWFAQVVNFLILKVKDISVFSVKISIFGGGSCISQFCVCISYKSCKLAPGKYVGQGKYREFENAI